MPLFVGIGWLWGYLCCVLHLATARRKWTKSWIVSIPTRFGILRQDKKSQKSTYLSGTICTIPVRRFATILLAMVVCCLARAMHFYYKIASFRQIHHDPCSETSTFRPGGEVAKKRGRFLYVFSTLKTGKSPVLLQLYAVLNMVFKNKGATTKFHGCSKYCERISGFIACPASILMFYTRRSVNL